MHCSLRCLAARFRATIRTPDALTKHSTKTSYCSNLPDCDAQYLGLVLAVVNLVLAAPLYPTFTGQCKTLAEPSARSAGFLQGVR